MTRTWRLALLTVAAVALLAVAAAVAVTVVDRAGSGSMEVDAATVAPVAFDHLPVVVRRAAGEAGGCPAHAYRAPTEPEGGGESTMFRLGDESFLLVVCLGRADQHPPLARWDEGAGASDLTVIDLGYEQRAGLGLVVRQETTTGSGGRLLTDWIFEREGWLFAVGHLRADAASGTEPEALLSSWTWG